MNYTPPKYARYLMPEMSEAERKLQAILIVESDMNSRNSLRHSLHMLGYGLISESPDHVKALEKIKERHFTHLIFESKKTNMPTKEFLMRVLEYDEHMIAIPSSTEPSVDDVFGLLVLGARGYVVKPFNVDSVDEAIIMATKGDPMPEAILYAKSRNEALSSLIMTSLDKLATVHRQAAHFETAKREIPRAVMSFRKSVDIGRTFSDGGDDPLIEAIMEFCVERASGPASKLGRLRRRLDCKKRIALGEESVLLNSEETEVAPLEEAQEA